MMRVERGSIYAQLISPISKSEIFSGKKLTGGYGKGSKTTTGW
jgi:hypothetical protein